MSRFKIADISFCEKPSNLAQVQGGTVYGSYSATYDSTTSSDYYTSWNRKGAYVISGYAKGAAGGAVASAVTDGGVAYVSTSVRVGT